MDIADILDRAADLIEPEGKWTRRAFARDDTGWPANWAHDDAICFCASGAIFRAGMGSGKGFDAQRYFARLVHPNDSPEQVPVVIGAWNDTHTQSEVVAKLREAAARARNLAP